LLLNQEEVFAHGQLYVGVTRVREGLKLRVFTPNNNNIVKNVVLKQLIDNEDIKAGNEAAEYRTN